MTTTRRQEKVAEHVRHTASAFLSRNSNRTSLITVTSVDISSDLKKSTIYVSVYPENKEHEALGFLKRLRTEFRTFAKKELGLRTLPFFDFEIDYGEKNRQKIDEISNTED